MAAVYGPRWSAAGPLLPLIAFITLRTTTDHSVGAVFLAQGRPEPLMLLYYGLGSRWGLLGFLAAWASVGALGWMVPHILACRVIGMRFGDFLRGLAPIVFALGLSGGFGWR